MGQILKSRLLILFILLWSVVNFIAWKWQQPLIALIAWVGLAAYFFQILIKTQDQLTSLEQRLQQLEQGIQVQKSSIPDMTSVDSAVIVDKSQPVVEKSLWGNLQTQVLNWMQHGNPILKLAIIVLLIGVVLLLRFASEYWQLSLGLRLGLIASAAIATTVVSYVLRGRNLNFAIALQGLGLAVVFLTLIFAYHFSVMESLWSVGIVLFVLLASTIFLSLKQDTIYLAGLALGMAYLAPLLIPQYQPDTVFLWSYYLVVNIAVVAINFIKPWKILNHLAFFATLLLGGQAILRQEVLGQKNLLDGLLWAHLLLFIWLSVRYSQLQVRQNEKMQQQNATLDVGLIFSVPVLGFSLHSILMHPQTQALTLGALALAIIYAALTWWIHQKQKNLTLLGKSFLILAMAFFALVFPLAKGAHWTSLGWVIQGTALIVWGVTERSRFTIWVGQILVVLSSFALFYQIAIDDVFPILSSLIYAISQCIAVYYMLQYVQDTQKDHPQSVALSSIFLGLALYSFALTGVHFFSWQSKGGLGYIFWASIAYAVFFLFLRFKANFNWQLQQMLVAAGLGFGLLSIVIAQGVIFGLNWMSDADRGLFLLTALLQSILVLLSQAKQSLWSVERNIWFTQLWGILALAGLSIFNHAPVLALGLFPTLLTAYVVFKKQQDLWIQPAIGSLGLGWLLVVNYSVIAATQYYWFSLFNPVDVLSLVMLTSLLWFIFGIEKHIVSATNLFKVLSVVTALWVLSSIMVRILHYSLATPLWQKAIWTNGAVQLSLTLLWVILASILMIWASKRYLREIWIIGASLLVIVVFKLALLDLAQTATLTRVISFIGSGAIMLVIAYLAPLPPNKSEVEKI